MPIPSDPFLSKQWHLRNPEPGLLDLNVFGVWNPSQGPAYTGAGIRVAVIDDGFDYKHPDFTNYDQTIDFDFETNTGDAFGKATEAHGTAVAGIIGAAANGTGAVGIAFGVTLIGYRHTAALNNKVLGDVTDAINRAVVADADVINQSIGISNDENSEYGVGYSATRFDEIEAAIGNAVNQGRGGLGIAIVKSAGNKRGAVFDVNADDWANDTRQVVVGAVDQNGFVSDYSSYGAALLVSAFGTPSEVATTDRRGDAGVGPGDYRENFDGTSAAAPMVSGIIALMYDANAGLGWRDVQSILANSARHVGSPVGVFDFDPERYMWEWNGADTWNGGGLHFSNDYGYGLVDALAAVRLAETWHLGGGAAQTSNNQSIRTMDMLNTAVVIPDGATGSSFSSIATNDDIVERVTVEVTLKADEMQQLDIYLISPSGTVSNVIDNAGNPQQHFDGTWTFESQAFRGERAEGTWTVKIVRGFLDIDETLIVSDIVVRTYGSNSVNDRYVFTNEYSNYDGVAGHATSVVDTNGGIDVVNAAAVTSASLIRLNGTTSSIDGVAVTFNNIENAIGGDKADTIIGNGSKNTLYGMRGNDTISGDAGNDILFGSYGDDVLNGGDGDDRLMGGAGRDVLTGNSGVDRFDFDSKNESKTGSTRDKINDLKRVQGDRIDLKDIDANTKKDGNQTFIFIGDDTFSSKPGQLRYEDNGATVIVQGDVNGDGKSDFEIRVDIGSLMKDDFIL